jgi:hypothetical protein
MIETLLKIWNVFVLEIRDSVPFIERDAIFNFIFLNVLRDTLVVVAVVVLVNDSHTCMPNFFDQRFFSSEFCGKESLEAIFDFRDIVWIDNWEIVSRFRVRVFVQQFFFVRFDLVVDELLGCKVLKIFFREGLILDTV